MRLRSGFTLIEVVLAMSILTATVFIISDMLMRLLFRVEENRDDIEKVFLIKRALYTNFFKPPKQGKRVVEKLEEPPLTITSKVEDISIKSSLKDFRKNLKIVRSDAVWKKDKFVRESSMLSFIFEPEEKESK